MYLKFLFFVSFLVTNLFFNIVKANDVIFTKEYLYNIKLQKLNKKYKWFKKYSKIIIKNSKKYNVDITLICSVIEHESNGKQYAISRSKARGLMQIMYFHIRGNPRKLYNPNINIELGTKLLNQYINMAKGNIIIGLKNYNSGPYSNYYNWRYINRIIKSYGEINGYFQMFKKV